MSTTLMPHPSLISLLFVGAVAGALSGLFGIGGGVVIVPLLIYLGGYDQHRATGTSLATLLPPIGIGAAIEYYRHGAVDVRAAIVIAIALALGAWLTAIAANKMSGVYLRLGFAVFVIGLGISMLIDAFRQLTP